MAGRYAPSPSGDLHLGNLRTALVAWLAARSTGRDFAMRIDDLDESTARPEFERSQLADLDSLGFAWDGPIMRQSERLDEYRRVLDVLVERGDVYECFCSRREIREEIASAARAPHVHLPDGAYPGTCRRLTDDERAERIASGRPPALRLRSHGELIEVDDLIAGAHPGMVDDFVLARNDGTPSYHLAVVLDDNDQGVDQVVRGDDLLSSTPRHLVLYRLLAMSPPEYWHVPLVMVDADTRLAKRDRPVTLAGLRDEGWSADSVIGVLARSLHLAGRGEQLPLERLVERFDPGLINREPVLLDDLLADR